MSKAELIAITYTRKLLVHYCEATLKAPKEYHRDLCRDVKFDLKDALHYLRAANNIDIFEPKRLELQEKAEEKLERVNDLLSALEALGAEVLSISSCSALKMELQKILQLINGWIKSDRSRVKEKIRKRRKNAGFEYGKAKERYDRIKEYYAMLPESERAKSELELVILHDEAYAWMQVKLQKFKDADAAYKKEIERLESRKENPEEDIKAMIKIIDTLDRRKLSKEQILEEIKGRRYYAEKDKRKERDNTLLAKKDYKEEKHRERVLKKYLADS